jgi:hypothetical protein
MNASLPAVRTQGRGLGRLIATADFLTRIPRPVMIRALRTHANSLEPQGVGVETRHSHDGVLFRLRTHAGRGSTTLWLEGKA